jgi:hypothetical protein
MFRKKIRRIKMAKKNKEVMTPGMILDFISTKIGLKKKVIKEVFLQTGELIGHQLKTVGLVRIPHIGKAVKVVKPARKLPAGMYPNFFKKGEDGKPLMEQKPARTIPERKKIKFMFTKEIRDSI